jgi:hypothetical protein
MMRGSRVVVCLSIAVLAVLLLSSAAQAQMEAATLEGFVYDESGAVLPGVSMLITNTDNGSERPTPRASTVRDRCSPATIR